MDDGLYGVLNETIELVPTLIFDVPQVTLSPTVLCC